MVLAVVTVFILLALLLSPFFWVKKRQLQDASSVNSIGKLEQIQEALLKRYIEDEQAHREKRISKSVWKRRKAFLTGRYIDATRRHDYLIHLQSLKKSGGQ